jgi:hypothetical protein
MLRETKPEEPALPLGQVHRGDAPNFTEALRLAARQFNNEEFTVAHVEALVKGSGSRTKASNPRARIAMILAGMVESKIITITRKGAGNTPNRYRLLPMHVDEHEKERSNVRQFDLSTTSLSRGGRAEVGGLTN